MAVGANNRDVGKLRGWQPLAIVAGLAICLVLVRGEPPEGLLLASMVATWLLSVWWWRAAGRLVPYLLLLALKLVLSWQVAKTGHSTLWPDLDQFPELRCLLAGRLRFIQGAVVTMLAVTLVESWALGLWLKGKGLRDSSLWRRRELVGALLVLLSVGSFGWWQWRADYHLWRLRDGHMPSQISLRHLGEKALPTIYDEMKRPEAVRGGQYRHALVGAIVAIRRDQVAELRCEQPHSLVPPALEMLKVLTQAFADQPHSSQFDLLSRVHRLEFNMLVPLTCAIFAGLAEADRPRLVVGRSPVDQAWTLGDQEVFYGRKTIAQLDAMRSELACLPPLLLQTLEDANSTSREAPSLAEALAKFGQLDADVLRRLVALIAKTNDGRLIGILLPKLGLRLLEVDAQALRAALGHAIVHVKKGARSNAKAIGAWVLKSERAGANIRFDAFFCETFEKAGTEAQVGLLSAALKGVSAPCAESVVMAASRQRVAERAPNWRPNVLDSEWDQQAQLFFAARLLESARVQGSGSGLP